MKIYGPVSTFSQSVVAQLGGIALEMTVDELSSLRLTERRSIAAMGTVSAWNNRQVAALQNILPTFNVLSYQAEETKYLHTYSIFGPLSLNLNVKMVKCFKYTVD